MIRSEVLMWIRCIREGFIVFLDFPMQKLCSAQSRFFLKYFQSYLFCLEPLRKVTCLQAQLIQQGLNLLILHGRRIIRFEFGPAFFYFHVVGSSKQQVLQR